MDHTGVFGVDAELRNAFQGFKYARPDSTPPVKKLEPPRSRAITLECLDNDSSGVAKLSPVEHGVWSIHLNRAWDVDVSNTPAQAGKPTMDFTDREVAKRWAFYCVVEHDGVRQFADAFSISRGMGVWWVKKLVFDVSTKPAEATLWLFAQKESRSQDETQAVRLGQYSLGPFVIPFTGSSEIYNTPDSSTEVNIAMSFEWKQLSPLEDYEMWRVRGRSMKLGDLKYVKKTSREYGDESGDRSFLVATIPRADYRRGSVAQTLSKMWLSPVKFAFQSANAEDVHLLSQVAGGGHLFARVQRERRFTLSSAQHYAAQLVCIFEALQDLQVVAGVRPENIMVDPFGNIRVFTSSLFSSAQRSRNIPEIPPPEVVLGEGANSMTDWWTLGVFLFEMLTGLPPCFSKDLAIRYSNILADNLELSRGDMPDKVVDILRRLLEKNPAKRLGAEHGAADIKGHEFFNAVDWDQLGDTNPSLLEPLDPASLFTTEPEYKPAASGKRGAHQEFRGSIFRGFRYEPYGSNTEVMETAPTRTSCGIVGTRDLEPCRPDRSPPPETLSQELKTAMERKYDLDIVARIIRSGFATGILSSPIAMVREHPSPEVIPASTWDSELVPIYPLEYAVEMDRADLVKLFLDNGADPNLTVCNVPGPALVRAARKGDAEIIALLLPKTDRVSRTRALCTAVDRRSISTATSLLSSGLALCDFEEDDRPVPPIIYECVFPGPLPGQELKAEHFIPPLVRAVGLGDGEMVLLLLAHGADANAVYHGLGWNPKRKNPGEGDVNPMYFTCGRVWQMAMELGEVEIVEMLLDAGADVWLPHVDWLVSLRDDAGIIRAEGHTCPMVPRSVYLEVTGGLAALETRWRSEGAKVDVEGS